MSENRTIKVILFSDIVDSSGRMFSDETETIQLIERDLTSFATRVSHWGGDMIKTTGDGILATFSTSTQALDFIKEFLINLSKTSGISLQHRFGLHIGEIYHKNDDIIGQGVHLAARLQTISPVNGVAFTQGTHANIDPRYRTLAVSLGSISLKGVPEEIICYGITEDAFLGKTSATEEGKKHESRSETGFSSQSEVRDGELIRIFIHTNLERISNQPSRASAAFRDCIQEREHLLVGARDILSRPEWGELHKADDPNTLQARLTRSRLTHWIKANFSEATALPWIEALGEEPTLTPQHDSPSTEPRNERAAAPRSLPWPWIGLGTAGLAIVIGIATIVMRASGPQPTLNTPETQGVNRGSSRNVDIDRPLDGESSDPPALGAGALPQTVRNNLGLTERVNSNPDNDNTATSAIDQNAESPSSNPGVWIQNDLWQRLRTGLENGEITTSDLNLEQAQAFLEHWVQELNSRGSSLVIRLRTRQAVTADLCERVLVAYQRAYRESATLKPWVLMESSRSSGKDSVSGFLPVCQLSPRGQLILGENN